RPCSPSSSTPTPKRSPAPPCATPASSSSPCSPPSQPPPQRSLAPHAPARSRPKPSNIQWFSKPKSSSPPKFKPSSTSANPTNRICVLFVIVLFVILAKPESQYLLLQQPATCNL